MKNLVCIPSGKDSLHQKWSQNHLDFNFDLCLFQWDNHEFTDLNSVSAKFKIRHKDPKNNGVRFKMLYQFMEQNSWKDYDRIFWIDDDIETSPSDIKKFLDICEHYNFDLAQPALTHDSKHTYPITLSVPRFKFRLTNTVEIMMPCFSKRALESIKDVFQNSKYGYGWGMELMWDKKIHRREGNSVFGGLIGIVDEVPFRHARDLGSNGLYFLGEPYDEVRHYEQVYNVNWQQEYKFIHYSGVLK